MDRAELLVEGLVIVVGVTFAVLMLMTWVPLALGMLWAYLTGGY